jgi:hypothetical protein
MAEDVNPHWFRQQEKNHAPAGRAAEKWNPRCVRVARGAENFPKRHHRTGANRQQANGNEKFEPFQHARRLTAETRRKNFVL